MLKSLNQNKKQEELKLKTSYNSFFKEEVKTPIKMPPIFKQNVNCKSRNIVKPRFFDSSTYQNQKNKNSNILITQSKIECKRDSEAATD